MTRVINLETGNVWEFSTEDAAHAYCAEWCVENPGWESGIDHDGDYVIYRIEESGL